MTVKLSRGERCYRLRRRRRRRVVVVSLLLTAENAIVPETSCGRVHTLA